MKARLALLIMLCLAAAPTFAAQYYNIANGTAQSINEWGVCRKITNNAGPTIFIPTNTAGEWSSAYTYPPGGVTVAACPTWVDCGVSTLTVSCINTYPGFTPGGACTASGGGCPAGLCSHWPSQGGDGHRYNCQ